MNRKTSVKSQITIGSLMLVLFFFPMIFLTGVEEFQYHLDYASTLYFILQLLGFIFVVRGISRLMNSTPQPKNIKIIFQNEFTNGIYRYNSLKILSKVLNYLGVLSLLLGLVAVFLYKVQDSIDLVSLKTIEYLIVLDFMSYVVVFFWILVATLVLKYLIFRTEIIHDFWVAQKKLRAFLFTLLTLIYLLSLAVIFGFMILVFAFSNCC